MTIKIIFKKQLKTDQVDVCCAFVEEEMAFNCTWALNFSAAAHQDCFV